MPSFDQFAFVCELNKSSKREDHSNLEVKNIIDGYEIARYNRDLKMSAEEKSQRLNHIITHQPVQHMIGRKITYRVRVCVLEKQLGCTPPKYTLFDGCHRLSVIKEFIAGKCYVKLLNKEDGCHYYLWYTQDAVDAVTENKEYHCKIESELLDKLLECRVNMTMLNPDCTDEYAYERARMANQCKPLTHAQMMKCMSSSETFVAKLLQEIHMDDSLATFLGDDIYRYYFSLLRMFIQHGFQADFRQHAVMMQGTKAVEKAHEIVTSKEFALDNMFADSVKGAVKSARSHMNVLLENIDNTDSIRLLKLSNKRNSDTSAVGLFFFALGLACANANEASSSEGTLYHISAASIKEMMVKYLSMGSSEKGDNHRRLYAYFVTGTFPEATTKMNKKRKLIDEGCEDVTELEE